MSDKPAGQRRRRQGGKRCTVADVAERAGVGIVTVSRALNNSGPVAEATRQRIFDAARELGFRLNVAAQSTRTGRLGTVGLLMNPDDDGRSPIFQGLLYSIRQTLRDRDLRLSIGDLPDHKPIEQSELPAMLRDWAVDGMLVNLIAGLSPQLEAFIDGFATPTVWINIKREFNAVRPDDETAAYDATRTLLDYGHSRIAFLRDEQGADEFHYSVIDREAGYGRAMQEAGLTPRTLTIPARLEMRNRQAAIRPLLEAADRPSGFVCYERPLALPLYATALSLGLRVPADVSMVGIHDAVISDAGIRLCTMRIKAERLGVEATRMLLDDVPERGDQVPSRTIDFEWCPGDTSGPPPA